MNHHIHLNVKNRNNAINIIFFKLNINKFELKLLFFDLNILVLNYAI